MSLLSFLWSYYLENGSLADLNEWELSDKISWKNHANSLQLGGSQMPIHNSSMPDGVIFEQLETSTTISTVARLMLVPLRDAWLSEFNHIRRSNSIEVLKIDMPCWYTLILGSDSLKWEQLPWSSFATLFLSESHHSSSPEMLMVVYILYWCRGRYNLQEEDNFESHTKQTQC